MSTPCAVQNGMQCTQGNVHNNSLLCMQAVYVSKLFPGLNTGFADLLTSHGLQPIYYEDLLRSRRPGDLRPFCQIGDRPRGLRLVVQTGADHVICGW